MAGISGGISRVLKNAGFEVTRPKGDQVPEGLVVQASGSAALVAVTYEDSDKAVKVADEAAVLLKMRGYPVFVESIAAGHKQLNVYPKGSTEVFSPRANVTAATEPAKPSTVAKDRPGVPPHKQGRPLTADERAGNAAYQAALARGMQMRNVRVLPDGSILICN